MIKQGKTNKSILEKKFKILKTSIVLGDETNREENLAAYEKAAREIDSIKRSSYEDALGKKMYMTTSLEEEQKRLRDLIHFIENRIKERNDFIDDYIKVTSNFLDDLPKVSLENELPDFKARLDNIDEYLNNCKEIEDLGLQLKNYRDELEKKYENKANNEIINLKLEDELVEEFNKLIARDEYYAGLNYIDIDKELGKIEDALSDKKDIMNTFMSSYQALENAGISGSEKDEYRSYVQDARIDYYKELEKKYYLNIYKLVLDKQSDYDSLYQKRLDIDNILRDRQAARNELNITSRDELGYFINLCSEQFSVIKSQKFNIESINKLVLDINDCENKLDKLKEDNNRDEILDLVREFETPRYEPEEEPVLSDDLLVKEKFTDMLENKTDDKFEDKYDIKLDDEFDTKFDAFKDEVPSRLAKEVDIVPKAGNMVVKINDPVKMNLRNAVDTAKLVMKKVVIVLEPKKFNTKRDKLKEAELELGKGKKQLDFDKINIDKKSEEESIFIDTPVINLDTVSADEKGIKDTIDVDDIKVNMSDKEVFVPTEIFIEDKPEKKPELFSETDPFLDDNQFELEDKVHDIDGDSMPMIKNIGTVKPIHMVSKIDQVEEVTKENDDIILPTMGLSNSDNAVPIVPGNYIN